MTSNYVSKIFLVTDTFTKKMAVYSISSKYSCILYVQDVSLVVNKCHSINLHKKVPIFAQ